MEEYKPTLKEIIYEIGKESYNKFRRGFCVNFFIGGIGINLMSYLIPSTRRIFKDTWNLPYQEFEKKLEKEELSTRGNIGIVTGLLLGISILAPQVNFYYKNPEYLLIPLATNITSEIYERGKKAKERLIKNQNLIEKIGSPT